MDAFVLSFKTILACLLTFLGFGLVGARFAKITGAESNDAALHPFYGWAIASILMLAFAPWLSGGGMIAFMLTLLCAGLLMFSKDHVIRKALPVTFFMGACLLLPLLYILCTYPIHLWDDASHWLPNAHFMFQYGRFPAVGGPVAYSAWPAYPYGFTFLIACIGWVVGEFVETVGPLLNLFLLILFAAFLRNRLMPDEKRIWYKTGLFAILFLSITVFNPGQFNLLLFSAYAEYSTAVVLGLLLFTGWQYCQDKQRAMAIAFAMLSIVFVQIKQANIFLLIVLTGSLWITTREGKFQALKTLLLAIIPALLLNTIWEIYKAQHLPGLAFTFRPFNEWQWYFLPGLFNGMLHVALENFPFFIMLAVLIGWGVRATFKNPTPLSRLVIAFGLTTLGYLAFLTLAYIGSRFADWEITSAASFFRYMCQLQCAAMMIVILKIAEIVKARSEPFLVPLRLFGFICMLLIPIGGFMIGGFSLLPKGEATIKPARDYAHLIFDKMPPQGKIGLIGTQTDGLENALIRFEWCQMASPQQQPELTGYVTHYTGENTVEKLKAFAERYDAVMVAPQDDLAMELFGQPKGNDWMSFKRNGSHWDKLLP